MFGDHRKTMDSSLRIRQYVLCLGFLCTIAILIQQELLHSVQRFQINITTRYKTHDISSLTSKNITSKEVAITNHAVVISRSEKAQAPFFRINTHGDVYMISIISANTTAKSGWNKMVVNGWEAYKHKKTRFKCCYYWDNGRLTSALANKTYYKTSTHLRALQYRCPFGGDSQHLKGVAVEFYVQRCSKERSRFQVPYFPVKQPQDSVALCAKIVYGNISTNLLIDWIEYYREMKVSKIVMFTYNIPDVTRKILAYYQDLGFMETREFDFPWKVSAHNRDVGDKNVQAWQDEQVTVFDCQERLRGYSFVSVVDLDEFLLPLRDDNLKDMMSTLLNRNPTAAGFTFMSYLYIKDWGRVEKNNGSDIVQYFNRTYAIYTRQKNIFVPSRVHAGSVTTHELWPKPGFSRVRVPESLAVINHYRNCYKDFRKVCNHVRRTTDYSILRIYNRIKDRTNSLKKKFSVT